MKRTILIISLLSFFISGCINKTGKKNASLNNQDNTIVIEVWDKPSMGDFKRLKLYEEVKRRFEKKYPDIKIKGVSQVYKPEIFIAKVTGGKGPDCMPIWGVEVPTLAEKGLISCLDKYIKNWKLKNQFYSAMWSFNRFNNRYYGVPVATVSSVMTLWYRKDLFKKAGIVDSNGNPVPPRNWQELVEYGKRLTVPSEHQYGYGIIGDSHCGFHFIDYVFQAGGKIVDYINGKWMVVFNNKAGITALQFIHDLRWKYKIIQPDILASKKDTYMMFAMGKLAMVKGPPDELPKVLRSFNLNPEVVGIAPLPAGPTGIKANQIAGAAWIINSQIPEKKKDACWKYISFMSEPETVKFIWKQSKKLKLKILDGSSAIKKLKPSQVVDGVLTWPGIEEAKEIAEPEPYCPNWNKIKRALNYPYQAALVLENPDYKKLLDDTAKRIEARWLK